MEVAFASRVGIAIGLVLATACGGGDPAPAAPDAGPGHDASPDTGTPPRPIQVQTSGEDGPIEGAIVVLDLPDGERREAFTGPDGIATFEGVDRDATPPTITAWAEGRWLVTYARADTAFLRALRRPIGAPLLIRLFPVAGLPTRFVALSGTARNMRAPTDNLLLTTTAGYRDQTSTVGPEWRLQVRADEPFHVIGLDWTPAAAPTVSERGEEFDFHRWALVSSPPVTRPGTLDLDFAAGVEPVRVRGAFAIPASAPDGFFARAEPSVGVWEHLGFFETGFTRRADVAGARVDFEVEYLAPEGVELETRYVMSTRFESSSVVELGPPSADPRPDFLPPPEIVEPPFGVPLPQTGTVVLGAAAGESVLVNHDVIEVATDRVIWNAWYPAGTTELSLPAPPPGVDLTALAGGAGIDGAITFCEEHATTSDACHRWSRSRQFELMP